MATLPTPKKRKPKIPNKLKRTHVPPLPPEKLTIALQKLKDMPVHNSVKDSIGAVLQAAANPNAESIDVVIKTLDKPRRRMIEKTAKGLRELSVNVMARGKARLDQMSDEEWQRLVDDSPNG